MTQTYQGSVGSHQLRGTGWEETLIFVPNAARKGSKVDHVLSNISLGASLISKALLVEKGPFYHE